MFGFLLFLMMLDGVILTAVVLMQAGQGGGLASLGGGTASQVLGGRAATTLLTKATWITGGLFMALALCLSILSPGHRGGGGSAIQESLRKTAAQQAPAPVQQSGSGSAADILNNPNPNSTTVPLTTSATAPTGTPPTGTAPAAGTKKPTSAPAPVKKP